MNTLSGLTKKVWDLWSSNDPEDKSHPVPNIENKGKEEEYNADLDEDQALERAKSESMQTFTEKKSEKTLAFKEYNKNLEAALELSKEEHEMQEVQRESWELHKAEVKQRIDSHLAALQEQGLDLDKGYNYIGFLEKDPELVLSIKEDLKFCDEYGLYEPGQDKNAEYFQILHDQIMDIAGSWYEDSAE